MSTELLRIEDLHAWYGESHILQLVKGTRRRAGIFQQHHALAHRRVQLIGNQHCGQFCCTLKKPCRICTTP